MTEKDPAARFWADGFRLAEGLLPAQQCAFLRQCMDAAQRSGRMRMADNAAYRGPNNEYAPAPAELVLRALFAQRRAGFVHLTGGCAVH